MDGDALTHLDESGRARMVDVGSKPTTDRRAVARAVVRMSAETAAAVTRGDAPKGDVISTARIAGIQAAKRMKREVSELFGEEYARLAIMLNDARGWAKGTLPTYQDRKVFFESIVNGEPDPVALLRAGDEQAVLDLIAAEQRTHASA